jgi:hypothetical protein
MSATAVVNPSNGFRGDAVNVLNQGQLFGTHRGQQRARDESPNRAVSHGLRGRMALEELSESMVVHGDLAKETPIITKLINLLVFDSE